MKFNFNVSFSLQRISTWNFTFFAKFSMTNLFPLFIFGCFEKRVESEVKWLLEDYSCCLAQLVKLDYCKQSLSQSPKFSEKIAGGTTGKQWAQCYPGFDQVELWTCLLLSGAFYFVPWKIQRIRKLKSRCQKRIKPLKIIRYSLCGIRVYFTQLHRGVDWKKKCIFLPSRLFLAGCSRIFS